LARVLRLRRLDRAERRQVRILAIGDEHARQVGEVFAPATNSSAGSARDITTTGPMSRA